MSDESDAPTERGTRRNMTDTTLPPGDDAVDRIEPVDIQHEMQRSYIDYAMSVIVGRALPEVRDGLKPVHRRVLYAMYDSGFRPDRSHAKSARSVAETMGNYHPHGDASIYDTLVRMAQPWSLRYPLVDGQGNFGSPGNDPPPRCGIPRRGLPRWQWRCCAKSTRRQSISSPTTTAACKSQRYCPAGSPTCWPTGPAASRSAWRPTCRRTTCASSARRSSGRWRITTPTKKRRWPRSRSGSKAPTSRRPD